jgi:hypothetical protein
MPLGNSTYPLVVEELSGLAKAVVASLVDESVTLWVVAVTALAIAPPMI